MSTDKYFISPTTSFRLHYQYTFGILAVACLLVTSYSYIDSAGRLRMGGYGGRYVNICIRLGYSVHEWWRQDDSEGQCPQQILLDQLHLHSPQTL